MTACILTIIKNEHLYLDEWIQYHLNLGIDHIFIFEDIDSESHKDITDKYCQVALDNISMLLNESEIKLAQKLKQTKRWNVQHLYFRKALSYLKSCCDEAWCFVLDADEFITFEDKDANLNDVLSLYDSYDAFIMHWKCFGASGYLIKPDYSTVGVIDTYTQEVNGKVSDCLTGQVKTCYSLKKYDDRFFFNQHHPNDKCNWCNTDFKSCSYDGTYNNIYVRHYITKSWEEYVWKKMSRGFCWGKKRNFDFFFEANPEFNSQKEELIKNVK